MIRAKKIKNDKNIKFVMKTFATVTKTFHVNHTKVHVLCCSNPSSNGCYSGPKIFKPEKNLEFFRLKNFGSRVAILVGLSD